LEKKYSRKIKKTSIALFSSAIIQCTNAFVIPFPFKNYIGIFVSFVSTILVVIQVSNIYKNSKTYVLRNLKKYLEAEFAPVLFNNKSVIYTRDFIKNEYTITTYLKQILTINIMINIENTTSDYSISIKPDINDFEVGAGGQDIPNYTFPNTFKNKFQNTMEDLITILEKQQHDFEQRQLEDREYELE
jgi:hypothetical protein